jgi:hypothetical protein
VLLVIRESRAFYVLFQDELRRESRNIFIWCEWCRGAGSRSFGALLFKWGKLNYRWKRPLNVTFMWPCIVTNILIIKPTRCTNFSYFSSRIRVDPSWSCCSKAVYKPVWHVPLPSVQWITPDDGLRNCAKYAEFNFKNKFAKLVHLVGFIIRIRTLNSLRMPTSSAISLLLQLPCALALLQIHRVLSTQLNSSVNCPTVYACCSQGIQKHCVVCTVSPNTVTTISSDCCS